MKFVLALLLFALAAPVAAAPPTRGTPVFAVVMSRHGVRSFTHAPRGYRWPDWRPVAPGYLTGHGYRLIAMMGRYYRAYFAAEGLPFDCARGGLYVYADLDQRTLETARGFITGACSVQIPYWHDADMRPGAKDPLFDGADWMAPAGKIDAAASVAAVQAAAPSPLSAIVTENAAAFAAVQTLLDPLCTNGACPSVTSGAYGIVVKKSGLAEMTGPLDRASGDAESLFLVAAECGPMSNAALLRRAMAVHVLAYRINARNSYAPLVKGGTIFAHIVGLLESRAGMAHPDVTLPAIGAARVVMLSGHDTQLGALGGLLHLHWRPGSGIAPDDMPPGSALIFELDRMPSGTYMVDIRFAYQTLQQMRSDRALADGANTVPVLRLPLTTLASISHRVANRGFVKRAWTRASDVGPALLPLNDPSWSDCR